MMSTLSRIWAQFADTKLRIWLLSLNVTNNPWSVSTFQLSGRWVNVKDIKFFWTGMLPQNQEGSGGSGQAEGVWWHPPSLWQGGLFLLFLISQINAVEDDYHLPCLTINWEHKLFKTETSLLLELKSVLFLVVSHLHLCSTEKAYGRPSCSQDCASEAHTQSESFCGIVFNICTCFCQWCFSIVSMSLTTMSLLHALPSETKSTVWWKLMELWIYILRNNLVSFLHRFWSLMAEAIYSVVLPLLWPSKCCWVSLWFLRC